MATTLRQQRIALKRDFDHIFANGKRLVTRHLVFVYLPTRLTTSRVALIVSKKCFKQAVRRNYIKRLHRVLYQAIAVRPGFDVVVIARPAIARVEKDRCFVTLKNQWEDFAKCLANC